MTDHTTDHTAGSSMRKGRAIVAAISALVGLAFVVALGVILTREKSVDRHSVGIRGELEGEDEAEVAQAAQLDVTGVGSDTGKDGNDEGALDAVPSPSSAELRGNAPAPESLASDLTTRSPNAYRWNAVTPSASPHPSSDTSSPVTSWHTVPLQPYSKPVKDEDEDEPVVLDNPVFRGPLSDFVSLSDVVRQSVSTSNSRCSNDEAFCRLVFDTDNYPWENEWKLYSNGETVASGPPEGKNYDRDMKYIGNLCLPPGNYRMNVKDKSGDGMCCKYGNGGVTIVCDGEDKVNMTGNESFSNKNYRFSLGSRPPPPTKSPTNRPSNTTKSPTNRPSNTTKSPTNRPSNTTKSPTNRPSNTTKSPTNRPSNTTKRPTNRPTTISVSQLWQGWLENQRPTNRPTDMTKRPTNRPTNVRTRRPTASPTRKPSLEPVEETNVKKCLNRQMYYDVEDEVEDIANSITDPEEKAHFFGGIVRLAAHDFMDFSQSSFTPYGPDGCIEWGADDNAGLDTIWCSSCRLTQVYQEKYEQYISRADFWVIIANAVVRVTSVDEELDMIDTFRHGRVDRDSCRLSSTRLPIPSGCDQVREVFLDRMGLTYKDAVALMGGHSIGRAAQSASGHEGVWVDNFIEAQKFDKTYYEEMYLHAWHPRNMGGRRQDFTTAGRPTRVMLNTDLCLAFDVSGVLRNQHCCTRTDQCGSFLAARRQCPLYSSSSPNKPAEAAVQEMLGGAYGNNNNGPFYRAFEEAWAKATAVGYTNLKPLPYTC